ASESAVLLRDINAEEVRLAEFFDDFPGIFLGLVVVLADLFDLLLSDLARRFDDSLLLFGQIVVHHCELPLSLFSCAGSHPGPPPARLPFCFSRNRSPARPGPPRHLPQRSWRDPDRSCAAPNSREESCTFS